MSGGSPFWIVAVTKAQREDWAAENVARQGFEYYLPKTVSEQKKLQCLFPRYLFVLTTGPWRFLSGTFGITSVVLQGQNPAVLPHPIIAELKARENGAGYVQLPKLPERFKNGDRVRVNQGMFSGYSGIYSDITPQERVRVLLDVLGRKTRVLISEEYLEAVQ